MAPAVTSQEVALSVTMRMAHLGRRVKGWLLRHSLPTVYRPNTAWACPHCRRDWPCAEAIVWLRATYTARQLGVLMSQCMQAAADGGALRRVPEPELLKRFFLWIREGVGTAGGAKVSSRQ